MNVVYLFPGQGAQRPGMLRELAGDPATRPTVAAAAARLGLADLDAAQGTVAAQLATVIAGVASARELIAATGMPDAVAGDSVGAFAAAVVAGAIGFDAALAAVQARATMMTELFPSGWGMLAVDGLSLPRVERVARAAGGHVYVANVNARDQVVLAGDDAGLAAAASAAQDEGARRATRLAIAVPSHCPPLAPVADALSRRLATVAIRPLRSRVIIGSTGRVAAGAREVLDDLARGVSMPVCWRDGIAGAVERGAGVFVQMPPGRALARLVRRDHPASAAYALADTRLEDVAIRIRQARAG